MTEKVLAKLNDHRQELVDLSQEIWNYAELSQEETKSSRAIAELLQRHGFTVEYGVADLPTAFTAYYGHGKPVIGLLGEYDALPGVSQKPVTKPDPVEEGTPGHACGHNLLGTAMAGSAVALKELMDDGLIQGTIRYYGCPAEEIMLGKIVMVEKGLFSDVDICLTWHPMAANSVSDYIYSAMTSVYFNFTGRTAHAAAAPEQGRSALDAVELMNVGANYLREHVISSARIHYVITDGGGKPNVVPGKAQSWYYVRAPYRNQVDEIFKRLVDVARGAALMTETKMEYQVQSGCYHTYLNDTLNRLIYESMHRVPGPEWTDDEIQFAKALQDSLSSDAINDALHEFSTQELEGQVLHTGVTELKLHPAHLAGSTDVSNVSMVVPTAQVFTACMPVGTPGHTWQITACSGMSIGHKGMMYAAGIIADAAAKLFQDKTLIKSAWDDFISNRPNVQESMI